MAFLCSLEAEQARDALVHVGRTRTPTNRWMLPSKSIRPVPVTKFQTRGFPVGTSLTMGAFESSVSAPYREVTMLSSGFTSLMDTAIRNCNVSKTSDGHTLRRNSGQYVGHISPDGTPRCSISTLHSQYSQASSLARNTRHQERWVQHWHWKDTAQCLPWWPGLQHPLQPPKGGGSRGDKRQNSTHHAATVSQQIKHPHSGPCKPWRRCTGRLSTKP